MTPEQIATYHALQNNLDGALGRYIILGSAIARGDPVDLGTENVIFAYVGLRNARRALDTFLDTLKERGE